MLNLNSLKSLIGPRKINDDDQLSLPLLHILCSWIQPKKKIGTHITSKTTEISRMLWPLSDLLPEKRRGPACTWHLQCHFHFSTADTC